ncbi:carbon catabolite repressor protein 4, putative [Plasmodium gallinaceum]|uniref:Carbon catabolite repressor protein 4, putative n=1 Tax=Plasmodium gallinaceum TaxID=5849 RepID=A0A1J1GL90_PLAGA|nr:carbon catabolite repressor protein 4, putative [Plasmodium gallinaceum]CRG92965.1 carbon catabolite repressor protein 4, putative [Plasmodium gallinaceum]
MDNFTKGNFPFYKKNKSNESQPSYKYEAIRFNKNDEKKNKKTMENNKDIETYKSCFKIKNENMNNYIIDSLNDLEKNYPVNKKYYNTDIHNETNIENVNNVIGEKGVENKDFKKANKVIKVKIEDKKNENIKDINRNIQYKNKFNKNKKSVKEDNKNNISKDIKIRKSNILELNKLLKENLRIEENIKKKKDIEEDEKKESQEEQQQQQYEEKEKEMKKEKNKEEKEREMKKEKNKEEKEREMKKEKNKEEKEKKKEKDKDKEKEKKKEKGKKKNKDKNKDKLKNKEKDKEKIVEKNKVKDSEITEDKDHSKNKEDIDNVGDKNATKSKKSKNRKNDIIQDKKNNKNDVIQEKTNNKTDICVNYLNSFTEKDFDLKKKKNNQLENSMKNGNNDNSTISSEKNNYNYNSKNDNENSNEYIKSYLSRNNIELHCDNKYLKETKNIKNYSYNNKELRSDILKINNNHIMSKSHLNKSLSKMQDNENYNFNELGNTFDKHNLDNIFDEDGDDANSSYINKITNNKKEYKNVFKENFISRNNIVSNQRNINIPINLTNKNNHMNEDNYNKSSDITTTNNNSIINDSIHNKFINNNNLQEFSKINFNDEDSNKNSHINILKNNNTNKNILISKNINNINNILNDENNILNNRNYSNINNMLSNNNMNIILNGDNINILNNNNNDYNNINNILNNKRSANVTNVLNNSNNHINNIMNTHNYMNNTLIYNSSNRIYNEKVSSVNNFSNQSLDNFSNQNNNKFSTKSIGNFSNSYLNSIPRSFINNGVNNPLNYNRSTLPLNNTDNFSNNFNNSSDLLNNILSNSKTNMIFNNVNNNTMSNYKNNTLVNDTNNSFNNMENVLSNINNIKRNKNGETVGNKYKCEITPLKENNLSILDKNDNITSFYDNANNNDKNELTKLIEKTDSKKIIVENKYDLKKLKLNNSKNNPLEKKKKDYLAEIIRCELIWGPTKNKEPITPVESCELHPVVIIKDKFGHLYDDDEDNENNPIGKTVNIFYRWSRGPPRTVCFFHPQKIACLQCTVTFRCFCSYECFMKGFNHLHKYYRSNGSFNIPSHPNLHTYGVPCSPFDWDNYEKNIEFDEKHYNSLIRSGLLNAPDKEVWETIHNERNYIPCKKDIGHQLMLETMLLDKNSVSSDDFSSSINNNESNENSDYNASSIDDDIAQNNQNKISSVRYVDVQQNTSNNILLNNYNDIQYDTHNNTHLSKYNNSSHIYNNCNNGNNNINSSDLNNSNNSFYNIFDIDNNANNLSFPINDTNYIILNNTFNLCNNINNVQSNDMKNCNGRYFSENVDYSRNNYRHNTNNLKKLVDKRGDGFEVTYTNLDNVNFDINNNSVVNNNTFIASNNNYINNKYMNNLNYQNENNIKNDMNFLNNINIQSQKLYNEFNYSNKDINIPSNNLTQISNNMNDKLNNEINEVRNINNKIDALNVEPKNIFNNPLNNENTHFPIMNHNSSTNKIKAISDETTSNLNIVEKKTLLKKKKKKRKKKIYVLDDEIWNSIKDPNIYHKIITGCCIPNLTIFPNYNITCFKNSNLSNPHNQFTIMTWNVLAEIYGTIEAFPHCDPYMLAWSYRKTKIIQEILNNNPDIVCLQEIQNEHFLDFFKPSLGEFGYEGVYKQKTKEIFTSPSGKRRGGKYTIDGCAIFYNKKKLKFVETYALEFSKLIKEASVLTLPKEIQKNPSIVKRLLKDNVALVLLLEYIQQYSKMYDKQEEKQNKKLIIVANTHIVANPEANYVKIWQAQILVKVIEYLKINFIKKYETIPSLIICGDFNSTPSSAVYQLIYKKTCSRNHEDFNSDKYSLLTDLQLGHNLNLKSAYAISKLLSQKLNPDDYNNLEVFEPLFTNYTGNFIGCLDYIFYNDENLNIISTVNIADENQLMQEAQLYQLSNCALPSPIRPSDHLPLIAKFEFKIF